MYGYLLYLTKNWAVAEDLTERDLRGGVQEVAPVRSAPRARRARGCSRSPARPLSTGSAPTRGDGSARSGRGRRSGTTTSRPFGEGFSPELAESLQSLSAGEREVVALRIVLDLDGEEAARLLGITPTAVSTRLSRALSKLEERMRDHDVVA